MLLLLNNLSSNSNDFTKISAVLLGFMSNVTNEYNFRFNDYL